MSRYATKRASSIEADKAFRELGMKEIPLDQAGQVDQTALEGELAPELKGAAPEIAQMIEDAQQGKDLSAGTGQVYATAIVLAELKKTDAQGRTGLQRMEAKYGKTSLIYEAFAHFQRNFEKRNYKPAFQQASFLAEFLTNKTLQNQYGKVQQRGGEPNEHKFMNAYGAVYQPDKAEARRTAEVYLTGLAEMGFTAAEIKKEYEQLGFLRNKDKLVKGLILRKEHEKARKARDLRNQQQLDFFLSQNEVGWHKPGTAYDSIDLGKTSQRVDEETRATQIATQLDAIQTRMDQVLDKLRKDMEKDEVDPVKIKEGWDELGQLVSRHEQLQKKKREGDDLEVSSAYRNMGKAIGTVHRRGGGVTEPERRQFERSEKNLRRLFGLPRKRP